MITFYKNRDFGSFITDSFAFFKFNGKNYFKNFILINGMVLILLVLVMYFGFRELLGQFFNGNLEGQSYFFERYFEDNLGLTIITGIIIMLIYSFLMMLNFLYPVFYMKRVANGQKLVSVEDIISDLKTNSRKLIQLYFGLILLVIPAAFVLFAISYAMVLILIGIPVILFIVPTLFNAITFLVYDFIYTNRGFFGSLSYAIRSQFSYANGREKTPYWKYWGSTIILFVLYYVITSVFTAIPMVILMMRLATTTSDNGFEQNPFEGGFGAVIMVVYGISVIISALLMNVLYINSGLLYFDSRRDLHQKLEIEEIESIGLNA
ncbi:hypothetical protein ASG31_00700 [Chryseobacterium sp. Leaf404]|uniref:hypothetical protein n=1 Tax=unclassified Chryseobacterium TaxID=2593645 RepID=UPI0006FDC018|nr:MULTISPECIES: hypothetical protein [unclassified Chryseobacterium]KQT21896.1 hypothetical protein ASG31_00700 [Chryseobacterium sp. Leaf404]